MTPDISGKDVAIRNELSDRTRTQEDARADLERIEGDNGARASTLVGAYGIHPTQLEHMAMQVRVACLIEKLIGDDPSFELAYEQQLAAMLDGLRGKIEEIKQQQMSGLVLPGDNNGPGGLVLP